MSADPAEQTPEPEGADEFEPLPAEVETLGNGWLLLGMFMLMAIGVLMLLIFASGGKADSSMML